MFSNRGNGGAALKVLISLNTATSHSRYSSIHIDKDAIYTDLYLAFLILITGNNIHYATVMGCNGLRAHRKFDASNLKF